MTATAEQRRPGRPRNPEAAPRPGIADLTALARTLGRSPGTHGQRHPDSCSHSTASESQHPRPARAPAHSNCDLGGNCADVSRCCPDDAGAIISWNTEAPGLTIKNPVVNPGSIAINPITRTRPQRWAPAAKNTGSFLPNAAGKLAKVAHYANARVDENRGTIICSTCSVDRYAPGRPGGFPRGVFHAHDYAFYYFDLRKNAGDRIRHHLSEDEAQ